MIILTFIFFMLAAFFNSVMDATENENIYESKFFRDKDPKFWYKRESWKSAKRIFSFHLDAWHIAKSSMILCLVASVMLALAYPIPIKNWHDIAFFVSIYGLVWNGTFKLFYNLIFGIR